MDEMTDLWRHEDWPSSRFCNEKRNWMICGWREVWAKMYARTR